MKRSMTLGSTEFPPSFCLIALTRSNSLQLKKKTPPRIEIQKAN